MDTRGRERTKIVWIGVDRVSGKNPEVQTPTTNELPKRQRISMGRDAPRSFARFKRGTI
jgi:hypothetical protein